MRAQLGGNLQQRRVSQSNPSPDAVPRSRNSVDRRASARPRGDHERAGVAAGKESELRRGGDVACVDQDLPQVVAHRLGQREQFAAARAGADVAMLQQQRAEARGNVGFRSRRAGFGQGLAGIQGSLLVAGSHRSPTIAPRVAQGVSPKAVPFTRRAAPRVNAGVRSTKAVPFTRRAASRVNAGVRSTKAVPFTRRAAPRVNAGVRSTKAVPFTRRAAPRMNAETRRPSRHHVVRSPPPTGTPARAARAHRPAAGS